MFFNSLFFEKTFALLGLLFSLLIVTSTVQAEELSIESDTSLVEVEQSMTLSVSGAVGEVEWTATRGDIQGVGYRVTYTAPKKVGKDRVVVLDEADNEGQLEIWVEKIFSQQNADWESFDTENSLLSNNDILALHYDKNNDLWMGTDGGGLIQRMNKCINFDVITNSSSLRWYRFSSSVFFSRRFPWWGRAGTIGNGMVCNSWKTFNQENSDLPSNKVFAIESDGNQGLWLLTGEPIDVKIAHLSADGQWTIFDINNFGLPSNRIYTFQSDEKGGFWLAHEHAYGFSHFLSDGSFKVFKPESFELPKGKLLTIESDGNDGLWASYEQRIVHLSKEGTWQSFNSNDLGLPSNHVTVFSNDNYKGFWLGASDGLSHWNVSEQWLNFDVNNSGLPDNFIRAFVSDGSDGLWIGTPQGITHLTFTKKTTRCEESTDESSCRQAVTDRRAAILIHPNPKGQDDGSGQEESLNYMVTYAYQTLRERFYENDDIYLLSYQSDLDINNDGKLDKNVVDAPNIARDLTMDDVRDAFNWAKEKGPLDLPLVVIFIGHGIPNQLLLDPLANQTIETNQFKTLLNDYQNTTGNDLVVIIEACYSGTFLSTLEGEGRMIVSSTDAENESYYLGNISFLKLYLDRLRNNEDFWNAWKATKKVLSCQSRPFNRQFPQLQHHFGERFPCLGGCFGRLPGEITITVSELPPIVPLGQPLDFTFTISLFQEEDIQDAIVLLTIPQMTFNESGHAMQPPQSVHFDQVNTRNKPGKLELQGKVSEEQLTKPGTYTLVVSARNKEGFSTEKTVTFCVESCDKPELSNEVELCPK